MVQLVTLPGVNLDCPDINMPILKGFLKEHQVESRHTDLNIEAFYTKLSRQALTNVYADSPKKEQKIDRVLCAISIVNGSYESTYETYQHAGDIIRKAMGECAKPYGLVWGTKGIWYELVLDSETIVTESLTHRTFQFFDEIFDTFVRSITEEDQYIVLSVTNEAQYSYAIRLAKKIKERRNPKIFVTGTYLPYISEVLPSISRKAEWIDHHILGYPEDILLEQISKKNVQEAKILETEVWKNSTDTEIESSHLSSTPDFSDLELSRYLSKELILPLLLSNGCYYGRCRFCSFHYGDGKHFLAKTEMIEQSIDTYVQKYQVKHILFVDRCIPAAVVFQMCQYIISRSYKISWLLETRIDPLYAEDENIMLLKEAGCGLISFGIESADQKLLRQMNKGIDFSLAEICMRKISNEGICVAATIMLLFLEETEQTVKRTLDYLLDNTYIDLFGILIYSVTKFSPIYFENKNRIEASNKEKSDLQQVYDRFILIERTDLKQESLIDQFFSEKVVQSHLGCVSKTLYRSHYLFWPKEEYSFQKRKQDLGVK